MQNRYILSVLEQLWEGTRKLNHVLQQEVRELLKFDKSREKSNTKMKNKYHKTQLNELLLGSRAKGERGNCYLSL